MSSIAANILKITEKFKPVLKKVLPKKFRQHAQAKMIEKT